MKTESEWYKRMLTRYGSEEAVSNIMSINAKKSAGNKNGVGGFGHLDPITHKKISSIGGRISRRGINATKETAQGKDAVKS